VSVPIGFDSQIPGFTRVALETLCCSSKCPMDIAYSRQTTDGHHNIQHTPV